MELVLKNINPNDCDLIFSLASRLGIQVEVKLDMFDDTSALDDLKDAIVEIKASERKLSKLQDASELINVL